MKISPLILVAGVLITAGCAAPEEETASVRPSGRVVKPYVPSSAAGLPVTVKVDPNALKPLLARAARFGSRSNPFLLRKDEIVFERNQTVERLFTQDGDFPVTFDPSTPPPVVVVEEAQPYRRLSGIVIGEAVIGILETQGQPTILIRPGQLIPGTDWTVVSLNEDRAVLRRPGNRRPNQVTVKLEQPPAGFAAAGGGTGTSGRAEGAGGGRGGGPPGAPSSSSSAGGRAGVGE